jgi:hypothetical protein
MPQKWNLQDIRPARPEKAAAPQQNSAGERRMSQDIAPRRPPVSAARPPEPRVFDEDLGSIDIVDGKRTKRNRTIIAVVLAVIILVSALGVNILMGGAEITVYPKFKDVSVQATFSGMRTPAAGELGYELLTLEATGERQVKASGSEQVKEQALGSIFIYNTDTKVQRLIKNTRFENPDGLIFRIKESVEVPAATKDAKGAVVPGVITAEVFADGPGEQYNTGPSRFTVPGLKDTPQFSIVYGESTVAMSGGFDGERYMIDEDELETKKQELHLELRNGLLERMRTERPAGFILFENAVTFTFVTEPATSYGDSLATIKEKAYLHVPIFKEAEFAAYLAESTIPGYEDEEVRVTEPEKLSFSYTGATTTQSDISAFTSLEFMLKGTTRIVWQFDGNGLRDDLLGLAKQALPAVLSGYPSIDRAEAVIRPFWTQNFPDNAKEIMVKTILDTKGEETQ